MFLIRWQLKNGSSAYTEEEALECIMEEGEEVTGGKEDIEQVTGEQNSFVSCFFCGRQFRSKQGCDVHMRNCDEKH